MFHIVTATHFPLCLLNRFLLGIVADDYLKITLTAEQYNGFCCVCKQSHMLCFIHMLILTHTHTHKICDTYKSMNKQMTVEHNKILKL